ncbi:MAG: Eco57I restriction-modification methylase domain-containing protein [Selenomonadaceae bacterium]|nr:Eco57I restriction-modification methylase domain-containing protein [Selenomonadaceae bacterium]
MIKIAVLGTGKIIPEAIGALQESGKFRVVKIWGREHSRERVAELAERFNIVDFTTNLDDIADDPSIDFVYIGVINSVHHVYAERFLNAGKNVIHSDPPVRGGGKTKTTEQKQHEKKLRERRNAIAVLRGVSIRMPLLIYGADIPIDEDFTIDMFLDDKIVDQESWQEFMPKGITKKIFKDKIMQYYDRDIFVAAGRNIRYKTKEADNLPPLERVDAIIEIFSHFKNPDKETVLTPWNVVDLHMSSAFDPNFFDEQFFKKRKKVLEINSKSGLYPLWVARTIYSNVFGNFSSGNSSNILYNYWLDIVRDNIFVICKTPMAVSITRRTLLGFRNGVVNAIFYDNIINVLKFNQDKFITDVKSKKFWNKGNKNMKFDAVVGNPPYQSAAKGDNKNYTAPVYPLFMEAAFRLAPITSLITPARFLFNAGGTKKEFNERILNDEHFTIIKHCPDSSELFPTSDIKGGIVIFCYIKEDDTDKNKTDKNKTDKDKKPEAIKIFIPFDELKSIHQKVVVNNENFKPLSDIIYSRSIYTLTKKFHDENPSAIEKMSEGNTSPVFTNIFERFPEFFFVTKPNDDKEYIQIYGRFEGERVFRWTRKDYISNHESLDKYKVFVPDSNGSGAIGEVVSTPLVGSPLVGCTQTFITVGAFDTAMEAQACKLYIETKFARAMLGILKVTQHNPPATWAKVPMQDFTAASDIDWSKTVAEIDAQLYRKYNLTEEEIKFIESHVKAMD